MWVSDPAGDWDGPFIASVVVRPGAGAATRERIRRTYGGALCVVERDAPAADQLAAVQRELMDHEAAERLGTISSSGPDGRRAQSSPPSGSPTGRPSIHPVLLGSGRRLFPDDSARIPLRLATSVVTTTGVVIATYQAV